MRLDMLKKLATAAMSQMSRLEKPAARKISRSASSVAAGSSVIFTAKSSIARSRADHGCAR